MIMHGNHSTQCSKKIHLAQCLSTEILSIQGILLSNPNQVINKLKNELLAQKYILTHLQLFATYERKGSTNSDQRRKQSDEQFRE